MRHSTESVTNNQSTTNNQQRTTYKPDWRLYAAAAGAALAFTTGADAAIIYSGKQDLHVGIGGTFKIGGQGVSINGTHRVSSSYSIGNVGIHIGNADAFVATAGYAINFNPGGRIGGISSSPTAILRKADYHFGQKSVAANFATGQTGFVGFQNASGGDGWVRLIVESNGTGLADGVEVIDWAYNDAGGGINAGQTTAVPEPSALGLLALGSAGVLGWRRRTSASSVEPRTPVTDVSKQQ